MSCLVEASLPNGSILFGYGIRHAYLWFQTVELGVEELFHLSQSLHAGRLTDVPSNVPVRELGNSP